jgi:hypothetical protein
MSAHGASPSVGCSEPDGVSPGTVPTGPVVASAGGAAVHIRAKRLKCATSAVRVRVAGSTVAWTSCHAPVPGLYHDTLRVAGSPIRASSDGQAREKG